MDLTLKSVLLFGHILAIIADPIISSNDQVISELIHRYNEIYAEKNLFKLLTVEDQNWSDVPGKSVRRTNLTFSIKETVCLKSTSAQVVNCPFIPGGVEMRCEAVIAKEENRKLITGHCEPATLTRDNEI
ncbi:cathelicidin-1-like isoform X2 [Mixophyes fleayi]|uniref:cathelicidin-1-like isoform X2 n=1 Tax=Mixophyes fleayi TaxID=3061075 RepID=UPI003F4E1474